MLFFDRQPHFERANQSLFSCSPFTASSHLSIWYRLVCIRKIAFRGITSYLLFTHECGSPSPYLGNANSALRTPNKDDGTKVGWQRVKYRCPDCRPPECWYRRFSRDVTRSRACLATPLIRHFGGQASTIVYAVYELQCVVYTSYQPACGVACLWMLCKGMHFKHVYHEISRQHYDQFQIGWSGILVIVGKQ